MTSASTATRWKWCLATSLAMVVLSMIPQIHLWIVRGRDWNGAYVGAQGDEPLYSGYINALIDGRPRKSDPFGGRDDSPSAPLRESAFSIQFIPAYAIALPARLFHVSASTAFIILVGVCAALASMSMFWLLDGITANHRLAAAGTLFALCLGWSFGRYGIFNTFFDVGIPALHFLRRYQPAVAFPLFFLFQLLVWKGLNAQNRRTRTITSGLAGVILAALIFSYLYLWTSAAVWLACLGGMWLWFRPSERRATLSVLTIISLLTALALVPYLYLISLRSPTLDQQQTITATHEPDLLRAHELLGAFIILVLVIGVARRNLKWSQPHVCYVASLALLPILLFNQQILTGRAMQPFHFEIFVVNYSTLVALTTLVTLFWTRLSKRLLMWSAAFSLSWGLIVVALPARLLFVPSAIANDEAIPVLLRLRDLSSVDGTLSDLRTHGVTRTLVFSPSVPLMALLPTWTAQGTLIDVGALDFGSATFHERKVFLYMHLYYSNVETHVFRQTLEGTISKQPKELATFRSMIFGHERTISALSSQFQPIQPDEIEREVQNYQAYVNSFSHEEALKRPITYAVIPVEGSFNFTNLDRWYERDAGERVGDYVLYRLKLKP